MSALQLAQGDGIGCRTDGITVLAQQALINSGNQ
ncbi:hypothetical protein PITCH_A590005 [uncultured Desulfobacterium sp.]|uniref:Uncharacterized protein n=1 Tax=uncultured Desulfobacterium sp. TaxID=201089 RepID=A0A445N123_9BACT|nr:hypothetical protein PITCH_A590005 [uncultured Desulfobacterium sp.]